MNAATAAKACARECKIIIMLIGQVTILGSQIPPKCLKGLCRHRRQSKAVRPDLAKFPRYGENLNSLGKDFEHLLNIWHNFNPTLSNMLCHWANFPYCELPKLKKPSFHLEDT